MEESILQEQIIALVRAFGLHKPDETPCGQPITVAEAYALAEIARERQLLQNDLVQRLNLAKSSVSRIVERLVERNWIVRKRSRDDGRAWLLSLTEAGENVAASLAQTREEKFFQVLNHIPATERENVQQALDILIQAMREASEQ